MQNYIKLSNFSFRYINFAYFDAPEYFADKIFVQKNLKIKFGTSSQKISAITFQNLL